MASASEPERVGAAMIEGPSCNPPLMLSTYPVIPWKAEDVSQCNPDHTSMVGIVPRRGAVIVRGSVANAVIEAALCISLEM